MSNPLSSLERSQFSLVTFRQATISIFSRFPSCPPPCTSDVPAMEIIIQPFSPVKSYFSWNPTHFQCWNSSFQSSNHVPICLYIYKVRLLRIRFGYPELDFEILIHLHNIWFTKHLHRFISSIYIKYFALQIYICVYIWYLYIYIYLYLYIWYE